MTFDERVAMEIEHAPSDFQAIMGALSMGEMEPAAGLLQAALASPKKLGTDWIGPAHCCYAHCLKQRGDYEGAVEHAFKGRSYGLNATGTWYFYDAAVYSLNELDRLSDGLDLARDAIAFYQDQNAQLHMASNLENEANILKQMAAAASRDLDRLDEAKGYALEAFHAYFVDLSINSEGWEELSGELEALVQIAARAGAEPVDFAFIDENPAVKSLIGRFVEGPLVPRIASSERFNMAVDATQRGDRETAREWWKKATESAREDEPNDRAFKALLWYQYGVCVLNLHKLEDVNPDGIANPADRAAVGLIQDAWEQTLRLALTLDEAQIREFDKGFPPGVAAAVRNILAEPLMKDSVYLSGTGQAIGETSADAGMPDPRYVDLLERGTALVRQREFAGARRMLEEARKYGNGIELLTTLATAEKHAGDPARAEALLKEAAPLARTNDEKGLVAYNLGNLYREQNRHGEAVTEYCRSIQHRREHVGVHFNLGQCYFALGKYNEAIEEYEEVLRLDPSDSRAKSSIEMARTAIREDFDPPGRAPSDLPDIPYQFRSKEAERIAAEISSRRLAGAPAVELFDAVVGVLKLEPDCEDGLFELVACESLAAGAMSMKDTAIARKAVVIGTRSLKREESKRNPSSDVLFGLYSPLAHAHFWLDEYAVALDYCGKALAIEPTSESVGLLNQWLLANSGGRGAPRQGMGASGGAAKRNGCMGVLIFALIVTATSVSLFPWN